MKRYLNKDTHILNIDDVYRRRGFHLDIKLDVLLRKGLALRGVWYAWWYVEFDVAIRMREILIHIDNFTFILWRKKKHTTEYIDGIWLSGD